MAPLLRITDLTISFAVEDSWKKAVDTLSFELNDNEILGIVGESGSGKSVTALGLMGLLPKNARMSGSLEFNGQQLEDLDERAYRKIRGDQISMIFQEPMSSLNPSLTCGYQVREMLLTHTGMSGVEAQAEVLSLFEKVRLPRAESLYYQYPHQLSGGQKQRVMIAMALACKPAVLIADEPTTALDVTVQKEIIDLLKSLQKEVGMSILFISHDLALVSELADRVLVMYQGKDVEQGTVEAVFRNPKADYTKALIKSRPGLGARAKRLPTVADFTAGDFIPEHYTDSERRAFHEKIYSENPLLEIKDLSTWFTGPRTSLFGNRDTIRAVDGVSLKVYAGETLGLVGESGCGKTTLGRTLLHLDQATAGTVQFKGADITQLKGKALKEFRKAVQIVFQDPYSSLNPRIPVGKAITEPMKVHGIGKGTKDRKARVIDLLQRVGLEPDHFYRYPHEFSGGQRQRIGIARAIALQPELLICDESVSALDVSVQAQVLNLLNSLKKEYGFTYLFISHDLSVVKYMSDQLAVMRNGKIVELGDADAIYSQPESDYTRTLIDAIPKGLQ
jgi:peptide/nickel transport system ATP-binding protein